MENPSTTFTTDPQRQSTRYRAERRLSELKPHEFNKRLYGTEPVDYDLVASRRRTRRSDVELGEGPHGGGGADRPALDRLFGKEEAQGGFAVETSVRALETAATQPRQAWPVCQPQE